MYEYLISYLDELATIVSDAMDEPGISDYGYDTLIQVWNELIIAIEILRRAEDSPFAPFFLSAEDIE